MSKIVSVRIDDRMHANLREIGRKYGWSANQTLRFMAKRGLGFHAKDAAADEAVWAVLAAYKKRSQEIQDHLADAVGEEIAEGYERVQAPMTEERVEEIMESTGTYGPIEGAEVIDLAGYRKPRRKRGRRGGKRR